MIIEWHVHCINRIRLEFKDQRQLEQLQQKHGINRIRLEFKDHTDTFFPDVLPRY